MKGGDEYMKKLIKAILTDRTVRNSQALLALALSVAVVGDPWSR
jgi:hypothetical protein